mgnify:CR=1 FL=1
MSIFVKLLKYNCELCKIQSIAYAENNLLQSIL